MTLHCNPCSEQNIVRQSLAPGPPLNLWSSFDSLGIKLVLLPPHITAGLPHCATNLLKAALKTMVNTKSDTGYNSTALMPNATNAQTYNVGLVDDRYTDVP